MTFEEHSAMSVYCGSCGAAIASAAKFCPSCGTDQGQFVDASPESSPAQTSSAPPSSTDGQATGAAQPPAGTAATEIGVAPVIESPAPSVSTPGTARAPVPSSPAGPTRGSVLTSPWRTAAGHRRSVAWIYYALIAVGALILGFQHPAFLLVAIVAGLYSTYLFRGGRFVIWFW